jgi:hypothetical protein
MFLKTIGAVIMSCLMFGCSNKPEFIHHVYEFSHEQGEMYERTTSTLTSPDTGIEFHFDVLQIKLKEKAANYFNRQTAQQYSYIKTLLTSRGWKELNPEKCVARKELHIMIGWSISRDGVFSTDEDHLNIENAFWRERKQMRCRTPFMSSPSDTEFISELPTIAAKL